jgi:hypothetical protein
MEDVCHGTLEGGAGIFEAEGHDTICKRAPWGYECGFVLIGWVDLNLVVAREAIHKGESLMASTIVDNLINERRWEVVFWTSVIEIAKVRANADGALFLVDGYRVGNPRSVSDRVDESCCAQFVYFGFDSRGLSWVKRSLLLANWGDVRPGVDAMFDNRRVDARHLRV